MSNSVEQNLRALINSGLSEKYINSQSFEDSNLDGLTDALHVQVYSYGSLEELQVELNAIIAELSYPPAINHQIIDFISKEYNSMVAQREIRDSTETQIKALIIEQFQRNKEQIEQGIISVDSVISALEWGLERVLKKSGDYDVRGILKDAGVLI